MTCAASAFAQPQPDSTPPSTPQSEKTAAAQNAAPSTTPNQAEPGGATSSNTPVALPDTVVLGSKEQVHQAPGSAYFLTTEEIRYQNYDDINQVLRKVPGVYLREEDGFGLFPNISLRGVDTTRSAKITMMEDGVLTAPAPYSAPDAYYSPTAARMSSIEVLKGSAQVRYGPHTTGGVLNYISTPIPDAFKGYVRTTFGSDMDIRVHANYGGTLDLGDAGRIGFIVENYYRTNDGFKETDSAPNFNRDDTGFEVVEPMFKVFWEPNTDFYQRWELKVGYTDRDANETYLGLSDADFGNDPWRRYAASRFDQIDTYATRTYLKHFAEFTENFSLSTTLYGNRFHRNWYKLDSLRNIDTTGDGTGDGVNQNLGPAVAGAAAGGTPNAGLEVLRGQRAGTLRVRANNRDYYAYGAQIEPTFRFDTGELDHTLTLGFRYHYDQVFRFQHNDDYVQNALGAVTSITRGTPGSESNRTESTDAAAFYVKDDIEWGRFVFTPGFRFEHLWQEVDDNNTAANSGRNELNLVGGGVGVAYRWDDQITLFTNIHRGVSPPGPLAAVVQNLEEESSTAFETGIRYQSPRRAFTAELVGFYTMFDDLIVLGNVGGAGSGLAENVGEVDSSGIELLLQYDPGLAYDWGFKMPNFLSFTWTEAKLTSDSNSTDAESLFAGGLKGNRVPYIPEFLLTIGTGLDFGKFGGFITGSFVDEAFTSASNVESSATDARFGKLDAHFIVDVSGFYKLTDQAKVIGGVHNLFEEEYVASRHPAGARPGAPRFLYVGMEVEF